MQRLLSMQGDVRNLQSAEEAALARSSHALWFCVPFGIGLFDPVGVVQQLAQQPVLLFCC